MDREPSGNGLNISYITFSLYCSFLYLTALWINAKFESWNWNSAACFCINTGKVELSDKELRHTVGRNFFYPLIPHVNFEFYVFIH